MKDSYIIGLNVSNHDSSACLLKNGEIISFIEQERISRNKIALGEAPIDALKVCLEKENISLEDVEAIGVGMDWSYRKEQYKEPETESDKYLRFNNPDWYLPQSIFGEKRPPIYPIRHHLAHAASAFRISGFENSAVLVIDNRGEDASTSLGIVKKGEISFFKQLNIHNSLGVFYNRACRFTGLYGKYREVGKFMGLASYGLPILPMPLAPSRDGKLFTSLPNIENETIYNSIQFRTEQLNDFFQKNCFPYESDNIDEIMSYANFAASAQKALEDVILDFVTELKEVTNLDNLVLSGGVAMNCSANGKIEKSGLFKNIYVPPFASDSGTAIGAALELNYQLHGKKQTEKPLSFANLGIAYSENEILSELIKNKKSITWTKEKDENLFKSVAQELADGKIIGWMQGKFEAGPRALGNRSILADPRKRKSLIKLNKIKQREMWRPIAPSVLKEFYSDYFDGVAENKLFMNVATTIKKEKMRFIPAVVHVDGTARPQIVLKNNEQYYRLISAFYDLTNIPLICNTSFNEKGIPLVNTPSDAINCFLRTDIDILVIENYIIKKSESSK